MGKQADPILLVVAIVLLIVLLASIVIGIVAANTTAISQHNGRSQWYLLCEGTGGCFVLREINMQSVYLDQWDCVPYEGYTPFAGELILKKWGGWNAAPEA